ncbi:3-deoxy-manno-octulosonate-8-phosphatase KdsC [Sodalis-like secondary symbiont of Drepanosiphum platanoidis]|uniref:3-deoxy-manno-octulosonate-8-phosphatase KdsC n=1 Tax=Sodalis-like secondary symbiont of Drepanosiphum platanoidis TaxID=2994493 RepID=UPI003464B475
MYKKKYLNKFYYPINRTILNSAKLIKLLICDVDGVLSNGMIFLGKNGEEIKSFNIKDGYGIKKLIKKNIEVAIITGGSSISIKKRCKFLGIKHIYQNQSNKINALNILLKKINLNLTQVAYIGDDLIDKKIMNIVGLSIAVSDAHPLIKPYAHYITKKLGGYGAVREICDLILSSQN